MLTCFQDDDGTLSQDELYTALYQATKEELNEKDFALLMQNADKVLCLCLPNVFFDSYIARKAPLWEINWLSHFLLILVLKLSKV